MQTQTLAHDTWTAHPPSVDEQLAVELTDERASETCHCDRNPLSSHASSVYVGLDLAGIGIRDGSGSTGAWRSMRDGR